MRYALSTLINCFCLLICLCPFNFPGLQLEEPGREKEKECFSFTTPSPKFPNLVPQVSGVPGCAMVRAPNAQDRVSPLRCVLNYQMSVKWS